MERGKLIVFEGIDGSGKSSQYQLVCKRLEAAGISFNHIVFPRYSKESSSMIRMYLNGCFGENPEDVNAYTASTFYAVDRFASYREEWGKIYENGGVIISDRYTTSNAVHQGSKLSPEDQPEYFRWLADLEYHKMGLPEPDLVIYLDVDLPTSFSRMKKRTQETGVGADIHEKNATYLEKCLNTARNAADYYRWEKIDFMKNGVERELSEKNDEIFSKVYSCIIGKEIYHV